MKYLIIYSLVFLGIINVCYPQTIEDYLKEAATNNPKVKAKYAQFEATMQRIPQVKALPDPTLSLGFFISPIETRVGSQRAKVSINQMFPWFGTLIAKENKATLMAEAKFQEFQDEKNKLFLKVKKAYYPLYEIHAHIVKQKANLEILKTYKSLATTSFSNFKSSMTDIIRVDIMIENIETEIQLLNERIKPLEVTFNKLLNRNNSEQPIVLIEKLSIFPLGVNYRKDSLLVENPILKVMDFKVKSAKAQEEIAKKLGLPKIGIGLDYALVQARTDMDVIDNGKNIVMPMVSFTLPLARNQYKASVKEAQFQQEALQYQKEEMSNQLMSSYEHAWYEIEKSQQLDELYTQQIVKTQQVIDLLYTAYSNSGKDFEEVLRMQQHLLKYEMAKATTLKNFYLALAQLDYLTAKSE